MVQQALAAALLLVCGTAMAGGPSRVMSLNQCTDQLVLALLPPERITSVTWLSRDPSGSVMAEAAQQVPVNRGTAEEVLRDRPDLVIAGQYTTPATRALLRRLGHPLVEVGAIDSFDDIRRATRQVGAAVGASARAEQLIAQMDAKLDELARTPVPPLRVAAWDGAGFSARSGSLYDTLLTAAGAVNVAAQAGRSSAGAPDVEMLLTLAPSLLVRGAPGFQPPGRRHDVAHHPLVRRYWHDRTLVLPQAAYVCGTPFSARAALKLRHDLQALEATAREPLPFASPRSNAPMQPADASTRTALAR